MSWVLIDKDSCTHCGICAIRCPRCFTDINNEILVSAGEENCNLCGHCVSLCPEGAIVHHEMNMGNFIDIGEKTSFETAAFIQFLQERRSHRRFRDRAIPRKDLETLIDTCGYAPTGSNVQSVEVFVIQDQGKIRMLSDMTVDFFADFIEKVEEQVGQLKADEKDIPEDLEFVHSKLEYRKRLVEARAAGLDPIFYSAPAVIIFHSPAITSTPKDNCVIAAHTMALTARTMGLETCYIGLFEAAAWGYPPLRDELKLPPGNNVYSVLIMGYPLFTFLKTVDRKPIRVRWE